MDIPYCLPILYVNQRYCGAAIFKLVCSNIFIRVIEFTTSMTEISLIVKLNYVTALQCLKLAYITVTNAFLVCAA